MSRVDHLLNQPVTLIHRVYGAPDRYGQPTVVDVEELVGAHVRQVNTADQLAQGIAAIETIEVYLPPETAVTDHDAVEWNGDRYEVQGFPKRPWNPRLGGYEYVSVLAQVVTT